MGYKICVLGETAERAHQMLDALCEENADDIAYRKYSGYVVMRDGTVMIARSISNDRNFDGLRFDQVFYEGYLSSWRDIPKYQRVLNRLESILMKSVVPHEFQWQLVDW